MKLVSYEAGGRQGFGAVVGDGIVEFDGRWPGVDDVASLLADPSALTQAAELAKTAPPGPTLAEVTLLPPVTRPGKVICVGINYVAHAAEAGRTVGKYPVIFQRYAQTLTGHGAPLLRPKVSDHFDYEGELAVVIGRGGSHIAPEEAMAHVAGYTVFNDASVRDWQFHTHQYGMGKNFHRTGALGPWLVTADDIPDYRALTLRTVLNGEQMQYGELSQLAFDVPALIAYVSQALPWEPGDVLATGTPSGIGFKRTPPIFLKPGDRIEITIDAIGTLSNPVEAEL